MIGLFPFLGWSQEVDPDGYNKFYYPSGEIASEGRFENGKPQGEWISYYPNGELKSKGDKDAGLSVGTWVFYDKKGRKEWRYEYEKDVKFGCAEKFDTLGNVIEELFFVNGILQGEKTWYYSDGSIRKTVKVENGEYVGEAIEYRENGDIITIEVYDNGFLQDKQVINRYDENGNKTGIWREYHPNGVVKAEIKYRDGKQDGVQKYYNKKGKLIEIERMIYGEADTTADQVALLTLHKEFHPNGKVKSIGAMKNGLKDGVFRLYNENGELITGNIYEKDTLVAEGFISADGIYNGDWKLYYKNGQLKAEGAYENGVQTGKWIYYFENGRIEQKGTLKENKYVGYWEWYYPNGQLKRTETYNNRSELNGTVTEFDSLGNEIARGDYYNGNREGDWFYHVNDYKEVGAYTIGFMDGVWKSYYQNGKLHYIGEYSEGEPVGKHTYYFKNGLIMLTGKYTGGVRHGTWKKYNDKGEEIEKIVYKHGEIYKINGFKVFPVEEE